MTQLLDDAVRRLDRLDAERLADEWPRHADNAALFDEVSARAAAGPPTQEQTSPVRAGWWRRRRPLFLATALTAAVALVVGPAVLPRDDALTPDQLMLTYEPSDRSVTELLLQAARSADEQAGEAPVESWRTEQWAMSGGPDQPAVMIPRLREYFRTEDGLYYRSQSAEPIDMDDPLRGLPQSVEGELTEASDTASELAKELPESPDSLVAEFRSRERVPGGPPRDVAVFGEVRQILANKAYVSQEQRSSLLEALTELDDIEIFGEVTDRAGRTGTAIGLVRGSTREELIIDPESGDLLAAQSVLLEPMEGYPDMNVPAVLGYTLFYPAECHQ